MAPTTSATLAALDRNPGKLRGVAVIPSGLPRPELEDMHRRGMRGCRHVDGGERRRFVRTSARAGRGKPLTWAGTSCCTSMPQPNWWMWRRSSCKFEARLCSITSPGSAPPKASNSEPFRTLLRLLDTDRCWIKLASLYRLSSEPYPHRDMLPMIRKVVDMRPDRILWGSNWPHPICPVPMPNDGDLVDLIPLWLPDRPHAATRLGR